MNLTPYDRLENLYILERDVAAERRPHERLRFYWSVPNLRRGIQDHGMRNITVYEPNLKLTEELMSELERRRW